MGQRSSQPRRGARPRLPRRLGLVVAALSMLAMPVEYRGGAEAAHPHVFFQVWSDARNGSWEHHHRAEPVLAMTMAGDEWPTPPAATRSDNPAAPPLSPPAVPETKDLAGAVDSGFGFGIERVGTHPIDASSLLSGQTPRPEPPPPRATGDAAGHDAKRYPAVG